MQVRWSIYLVAGTAISATVGGFASVAGGGKFANGAVTGAFGYLCNWVQHEGKFKIDGVDIGNDAHLALETYAVTRVPGSFAEQYSDGQGTWFGGRVDIGNIDPVTDARSILEIKSPAGVADGIIQVLLYSLMSAITGRTYTPSTDFLFANRGMSTITVPGVFGTYTFAPAADGVVVYSDIQLNQNVERVPYWVGGQRSLTCVGVCFH